MLTLYGASELDDEYFSFNSDDFAEMENKHRCPAASSIEIFQEQECVNIVHDERGFFSLFHCRGPASFSIKAEHFRETKVCVWKMVFNGLLERFSTQ